MDVNERVFAVGQVVWVLVKDFKVLGNQISMTSREMHKVPWVVVETEIKFLKVRAGGEIASLFVGMWSQHYGSAGGTEEVFLPNVYTTPVAALEARDYQTKKLLERGQEVFKYRRGTYALEGL
jgi:hypothetical protein